MPLHENDALILRRAVDRDDVRWWGSDCVDCGNTTPDSMRCDSCGSNKSTRHLFIVDPPELALLRRPGDPVHESDSDEPEARS